VKAVINDGEVPIDEGELNRIAAQLDDEFNPGLDPGHREIGYVLLVFPFNTDGPRRCHVLSNGAERSAVTSLFKELLAQFEGMPTGEGHG